MVLMLCTLRSLNLLVVRAGIVSGIVPSEKGLSAFRLAAQNFSVNLGWSCTGKHCRFESVCGSEAGVSVVFCVEHVRLPGVGVTGGQHFVRY
jgi:hypothetical protein